MLLLCISLSLLAGFLIPLKVQATDKEVEEKIIDLVERAYNLPTRLEEAEDEGWSEIPVKRTVYLTVTAYSSTVSQTDSTPYITASGQRVKDGIVAVNFLSFGTRVRFPDKFGDKVFIVEDRMHPRNSSKADIWFSTLEQAREFGAQRLKMEIL